LTTAAAGTTEEHITYHEGKGGREGKEEVVSDWRISQPWAFIFESSTWFGKMYQHSIGSCRYSHTMGKVRHLL
jgi:hypothetical protein